MTKKIGRPKKKVSLKEIGEAQRKYVTRSNLKRKNVKMHYWLKSRGLLNGFFPLSAGNEKVLDANGKPRHDQAMARFIHQCGARKVPCNITNEDWIRHLNTEKCDVCGSTVTAKKEKGRHKHLDHCHETGKYRGTLCHQCNVAEGLLKTEDNVKKLLDYIQSFNA